MARIGESAQAAQSMSNLTDIMFRYAMMKQAKKDKENEERLRRELMGQDNARWVAQDTYRREQDGIRQGEYADRLRRDDERFKYQQEQDTYKNRMSEAIDQRDYTARQLEKLREDDLKLEALKQKYQADAAGAGARDYMPKPFEQDVGGTKMRGLYNPSTGSFELAKPERGPTVRITERDPSGNTSVSRTVGMEEYEQQKLAGRPQEDKYKALQEALAADPDFGATMRKSRTAQPAGTGAFAPPQNAPEMGNLDKAAILEEAAKAIQAGKDPLAVKKRLQEMGIQY